MFLCPVIYAIAPGKVLAFSSLNLEFWYHEIYVVYLS